MSDRLTESYILKELFISALYKFQILDKELFQEQREHLSAKRLEELFISLGIDENAWPNPKGK